MGFVLESRESPGGNAAGERTVRSQVQPAALGTLRAQPLGQGSASGTTRSGEGLQRGWCVCVCVCVCARARTYHLEVLDPLGYSPFPQGGEERARKGRIWGPRV